MEYNREEEVVEISSLRDQNTSAAELSAFDWWQQQSAVVADSEDNFKAFIYAPPS
ncbi:hypothetical protein EJ02DRAFT_428523 [Clathrospora elynae]|uniref:Uncharacterized protein n=1 Tax=Clathrospora elynae TaxID=706981 RepID=A0A6A5S6W7_9PLEO|nr:hypothetical protein EJ02DRAFT_428523 [Clathrospora elynae]